MTHNLQREVIQQYDIPERAGKEAIFNSSYLGDIPLYLSQWKASRAVLIVSKALYTNTQYIQRLQQTLGSSLVATKIGVGSHSPYADVIDITKKLHEHGADSLISIGSSSYSDACKIAAYLHATLPPDFNESDMESLLDKKRGVVRPDALKPAKVKLILVPTSLSASEWNGTGSCTNSVGKKEHFGLKSHSEGGPDLILLDPEIAATAPEKLWLSSGVRCVDHCVEMICNADCTAECADDCDVGLRAMVKGLKEYKDSKTAGAISGGKTMSEDERKEELMKGISDAQMGSRQAIKGLIVHHNRMGPSHAIGHQLGSAAGVMHGVTSCVMLAPVLRWQRQQNEPHTAKAQERVLRCFNETLGWDEKDAVDAMTRFVKLLGLPTTLSEVGVTSDEVVDTIAEKTLTDIWGGGEAQIREKSEVRKILDMVR